MGIVFMAITLAHQSGQGMSVNYTRPIYSIDGYQIGSIPSLDHLLKGINISFSANKTSQDFKDFLTGKQPLEFERMSRIDFLEELVKAVEAAAPGSINYCLKLSCKPGLNLSEIVDSFYATKDTNDLYMRLLSFIYEARAQNASVPPASD